MGKAPWSCVPGWDVPRDYFAPDEPDENEESFDAMVEERMDMHDALKADSEKLRQQTGRDHGPFFELYDSATRVGSLTATLEIVRAKAKHGTRNTAAWQEIVEIIDKAIGPEDRFTR